MAEKGHAISNMQALKTALREKTPERLYIFHGEEVFLLHHYLQQLKKCVLDELTADFNFHKLTAETFSVRDLADAVEALPMMAERTLVLVDEIDLFKLNEADRTGIIDILSDIPEYCTVVFTYETTPWKPDKRMKKLWEAIDQNSAIVEFPKQEKRDLVAWIGRHFAAEKKRISPELCVYLIEITGGTMTALAGEIGKIAAFSGSETITKSDIDAVTEPVLDAVVFQMTDLLGQGDYGSALVKLHQLLKMQQEPIAILGAIGGHFRRVSAARILLDSGKQAPELMRLYGLTDFAARKTMSAAGRFSQSFCRRASELVLEADNKMKTSYDAPERLLEVLVVELAREASHG